MPSQKDLLNGNLILLYMMLISCMHWMHTTNTAKFGRNGNRYDRRPPYPQNIHLRLKKKNIDKETEGEKKNE